MLFRVMDAVLAFPSLVLALAISAVLRQGLGNAMVAIAVVFTPQFARLTRGQVFAVKEFEFVAAARAAGASGARLALLHVLPNITSPIVVQSVLSVAAAIIIARTPPSTGATRHRAARRWSRCNLRNRYGLPTAASYPVPSPNTTAAASGM